MNPSSIDLIRSTAATFDRLGLSAIYTLGQRKENLSAGTWKFSSSSEKFVHFILFEQAKPPEVCFMSNGDDFFLSDLQKEFGDLRLHYNFRENYTEFNIARNFGVVNEIYFIKDNKFEIALDGGVIEKDPFGKAVQHSELCFNGFCLRLKEEALVSGIQVVQ